MSELRIKILELLDCATDLSNEEKLKLALSISSIVRDLGYVKLEEGVVLIPDNTWEKVKKNSISLDEFKDKYLDCVGIDDKLNNLGKISTRKKD